MSFNPSKCNVMHVTKKKPIMHTYMLKGEPLVVVELGVSISKDEVSKVSAKANRTLGFVKRNISEVYAERQRQQRPDHELVARCSNGLALSHRTCGAPASSYKPHTTRLCSTENARQQQTLPENRLLPVAVEVVMPL